MRSTRHPLAFLLGPLVLLAAAGAVAMPEGGPSEEPHRQRPTPRFGGPDAVGVLLHGDAADLQPLLDLGFMQSWLDLKQKIDDKLGLDFELEYTGVYFNASDSPGEDTGSSGMFRLFGTLDLVSDGAGALIFKLDHRHRYATIPASALGFEIGYVGLFEPPFSDQKTRLTNLYWRHRWKDGRIALTAGFLDTTDYVDAFALASPWKHFMNFVFSTGSAAVSLPDDATFGVAAGGFLTDSIYLIGSIADTNADPTDPFKGFESFFDTAEHFKSLEIGWTRSPERLIFDNIHATFWHADERKEAGVPDGWGAALSFSTWIDDTWMPFLRAGFAEDAGGLLSSSISTGFGYQWVQGRDLLGVGFNWGRPNAASFGEGLDDQYTLELFYRWQLARQLAVTPDLQVLWNPALDPTRDTLWVFGIRARIVL